MRQELEKYDHIRPANQKINEFVTKIAKKIDKYEKNLLRSKKVDHKHGDSEDLEDGSLDERIDKIIRSYGISYNRCPKFFNVCSYIILSSRLIRHELIEQGIDQLLAKAEG